MFSRFYINMVRAGEIGGSLDQTLARMSEYLERAKARLSVVAPLTLAVIILLLFASFKRAMPVLIVLGTLQASTWGWLVPRASPVEPFGFSLTVFVVAAGGLLMWAFVAWQRYREASGSDPLVHLELLSVRPLRSGLP